MSLIGYLSARVSSCERPLSAMISIMPDQKHMLPAMDNTVVTAWAAAEALWEETSPILPPSAPKRMAAVSIISTIFDNIPYPAPPFP